MGVFVCSRGAFWCWIQSDWGNIEQDSGAFVIGRKLDVILVKFGWLR
jgi:hypothetical protein